MRCVYTQIRIGLNLFTGKVHSVCVCVCGVRISVNAVCDDSLDLSDKKQKRAAATDFRLHIDRDKVDAQRVPFL